MEWVLDRNGICVKLESSSGCCKKAGCHFRKHIKENFIKVKEKINDGTMGGKVIFECHRQTEKN